jgi:hypothetical protein
VLGPLVDLDLTEKATGTWGDLYNAYCDSLFGTGLIPESVASKEAAWYTKKFPIRRLLRPDHGRRAVRLQGPSCCRRHVRPSRPCPDSRPRRATRQDGRVTPRRRLWTGVAPDHVHDDLDTLAEWALPFARDSLERWGDLTPFARTLAVREGGRILATPADDPAAGDPVRLMIDGVRRQRVTLRAVALCYDVILRDGDAIRLDLEHRAGVALSVLQPYAKKRLGRGYRFDEVKVVSSRPVIWA